MGSLYPVPDPRSARLARNCVEMGREVLSHRRLPPSQWEAPSVLLLLLWFRGSPAETPMHLCLQRGLGGDPGEECGHTLRVAAWSVKGCGTVVLRRLPCPENRGKSTPCPSGEWCHQPSADLGLTGGPVPDPGPGRPAGAFASTPVGRIRPLYLGTFPGTRLVSKVWVPCRVGGPRRSVVARVGSPVSPSPVSPVSPAAVVATEGSQRPGTLDLPPSRLILWTTGDGPVSRPSGTGRGRGRGRGRGGHAEVGAAPLSKKEVFFL